MTKMWYNYTRNAQKNCICCLSEQSEMQKFFVFDCENDQKEITIGGDDAVHISRSLRMKIGDSLIVCDGRGNDFSCVIKSITASDVTLDVLSVTKSDAEPPYRAVLYQALAKSDKMDTIVQKAVETGVAKIVPFESRYCIAKIAGGAKNKLVRWRRIALEAAKQCGRGIVPEISEPVAFSEALEEAAKAQCPFICYEDEKTAKLGAVAPKGKKEYSFFIGPEGGFSEEEIAAAAQKGIPSAGLGKRILRTETASSFVLACLCMENELQN